MIGIGPGNTNSLSIFAIVIISIGIILTISIPNIVSAEDTPECLGIPATIVGTYKDDVIHGTSDSDVIVGLSGNDEIYGLSGDDVICGGPGDDIIYGGEGNDQIRGDDGTDTISGDSGNDLVSGGRGNDILNGNAGNDLLNGVTGHDVLYGGDGDDILNGGTGNDTLSGQAGNDTLNGGDGSDSLYGGEGNDSLNGGNGDDTIEGNGGADTVSGGPGNDEIRTGTGNDKIHGGLGLDVLDPGYGLDILDSVEPFDTVVELTSADTLNWSPDYLCKEPKDLKIIFPIYNNLGLHALRSTELARSVCPGDTIVILSGNVSGEVDVEWLNSTAEVLEEVHTGVSIIAMTSGIQNITMAAPRLGEHFDGLAYTYEPNFENEPEFSWEFDPETIQNFEAVAQIGRTSKMKMIAYPTGRPVLQSYLWKYGWDYSLISGILDELIVETQTYCKDSAERYAEALRSLSDQHIARGMPRDFTSQITIAPGQPNTASVPTAIECVNEARKLGFDEILIWWSPSGAAEMMSLMQRLNR